MTDPAVVQIPRPKTPQSYDRGTTERTYQSLEQAIQNKHDKRGHLYLEPGKELVLTSDDSSAQYGIGLDVGGYIRIRDMSDGSIGTFSVAWAQVDGAQQEIADLQAYVDAADSTLTGSVSVNAAAIAANGVSIAGIETEITAARDGEANLAAKFSSVEGAYVAADAAEATARAALQATLESADSTLQSNIDSEASTRATADSTAAVDRTAIRSEFAAADTATGSAANTYTDAQITTEAATRAAADTAEATARQTLAATIGGTGVNLLPLEYTRFDGSIPTLSASSSLTLSYVADANISGPGGILVTEDGVDGSLFKYLVLADSLTDYNVRVTPGQTYIISAYFQSNISKQLGIRVRNGSDGSYTWVFSNENYSSGEANTWVRYSGIFVAPSGCESICVLLYGNRSRSTPAGYVNRWAGIMVEEQVGDGANPSPWSEGNSDLISASVSVLQEAFVDSDGNAIAQIVQEAAAGGGDPTRIGLRNGSDGSSDISLVAKQIFFGSDTTFEDTYDSLYTESGGYRLRTQGPFPATGDLVIWYGPDSVSLNSETKTNGVFALGTDGQVYYGSAVLPGNEFKVSGDFLTVAEAPGSGSSASTPAYSLTVSNNTGTPTYKWYYVGGSTAISISNDAISNPTWSGTPGSGNVIQATWRLIATDSDGDESVLDVIVQLSDVFA